MLYEIEQNRRNASSTERAMNAMNKFRYYYFFFYEDNTVNCQYSTLIVTTHTLLLCIKMKYTTMDIQY